MCPHRLLDDRSGAIGSWPVSWLLPVLLATVTACHGGPFSPMERPGEGPFVERLETLPVDGIAAALAFSRQGRALAVGGCQVLALGPGEGEGSSCNRGLVQLWNLDGSRPESSLSLPRAVTALAASPDGTRWVAGDAEGRLILSSSPSKATTRPLHQNGKITALAFSPDGKWIAAGSLDTAFPLGLMDPRTGGVIRVKTRFDPVTTLAFSPDGKTLAIGMVGGRLALWQFTAGYSPVSIEESRVGPAVSSLAFSPNGEVLAYGRDDGRVILWDLSARQSLVDFKGAAAVNALAFSPDGQALAIGEDNGKVLLIGINGATPLWSKRHLLPVSGLAYSPDGASLAVAAKRHVYIYHVGEAGAEPGTMPRPKHLAGTNLSLSAGRGFRGAPSPVASVHRLSRVLEIAQDEYVWLLPLDRLMLRAVEAMVKATPGAVLENTEIGSGETMIVSVGGRSLPIAVGPLRFAGGREGVRQMIRGYEAAQRFLLGAAPATAKVLEDVSISGVLAELGPGVRLTSQPDDSIALSGTQRTLTLPGSFPVAGESGAESRMGDIRVSQLKLQKFTAQTVAHVRQWLDKAAASSGHAGAAVLDLRDNPGGDMESAVAAASQLIPKGRVIAKMIARKNGEGLEVRSTAGVAHPRHLVVLVNERTSGTAELLACALRSSGAGVLLGAKTAGVDDVYRVFPLPGGEALRVSVGRFMCPDGKSLRWIGQTVDVEAEQRGAMGGIPLGPVRPEAFVRSRMANPLVVSLPSTDDYQLRAGIDLAACLAQTDSRRRVTAATGREGSTMELVRSCR